MVVINVLRGSGANVARGWSFGGVLSPPTSASSAFRFPELLECDFSMTGGVNGVRKTEAVGKDLECVLREGDTGETSGVGEVTESEGGTNKVEFP